MFHMWARYAGRIIAVSALPCLTTAVPVAHAEPDTPPVSVAVRITSFSPAVPKPGDTVKITGVVTNTGATTLTNTQAIICIDRERGRITDRAELGAIPPTGDDCKTDDGTTAFQDFADVLEPTFSRKFSLTVPWDQWHLGNGNGVYVVGVKVNGDNPDGSRERPGLARTLMPVVAPKTPMRTIRTAMMLPLQHRPTQLAGTYFANESLIDAMRPDGRLGRLVEAGAGKQVTWLIDPSTLQDARQLKTAYRTNGTPNTPTQPNQVADDWLAALDRAVTPVKGKPAIAQLPYGDPDVRTLEAAKLGRLVDAARELTTSASGPAGKPVQSTVWLENGSVNDATLAALAADHAGGRPDDLTLLSSWSWAPDERPDLDSSPLVRVNTSAGPVRAVVADQSLTSGGPDPAAANGPVQLRQRFAAETALLAMDGTTPVTVVAAPARGFDVQGSATAVLLQGLSLPWIAPITIDQVTGTAATVDPPAPKPAVSALNSSQLDAVRQIDQDIATYNALQRHSAEFKANLDRAAVRAASMSWRGFQPDGDAYRKYQLGVFQQQFGKIRIITADGGKDTVVTLSASKGQFPLTIENGTEAPIRVGLRIESINRDDLSVEEIKPTLIRGGNRYSFLIRASAQQNGVIKARAQLVTENGEAFGSPLELDIRAQQYGTVGWVLVAAAVVLLAGTSAIRIFRRIRSERRSALDGSADNTLAARISATKGTDG